MATLVCPFYNSWYAYGGTFTFENIIVGTVVPPSGGLTMANINVFLLGPELKLKKIFLRHYFHFFLGYQFAFFSNSNIKQAEYNVSKLYGDLTAFQNGRWGYGVKLEQYDVKGTRTFGTSSIKIFNSSLNIFYRF